MLAQSWRRRSVRAEAHNTCTCSASTPPRSRTSSARQHFGADPSPGTVASANAVPAVVVRLRCDPAPDHGRSADRMSADNRRFRCARPLEEVDGTAEVDERTDPAHNVRVAIVSDGARVAPAPPAASCRRRSLPRHHEICRTRVGLSLLAKAPARSNPHGLWSRQARVVWMVLRARTCPIIPRCSAGRTESARRGP
jgi:hypothetical protein